MDLESDGVAHGGAFGVRGGARVLARESPACLLQRQEASGNNDVGQRGAVARPGGEVYDAVLGPVHLAGGRVGVHGALEVHVVAFVDAAVPEGGAQLQRHFRFVCETTGPLV